MTCNLLRKHAKKAPCCNAIALLARHVHCWSFSYKLFLLLIFRSFSVVFLFAFKRTIHLTYSLEFLVWNKSDHVRSSKMIEERFNITKLDPNTSFLLFFWIIMFYTFYCPIWTGIYATHFTCYVCDHNCVWHNNVCKRIECKIY